jgi:hypothetical protein
MRLGRVGVALAGIGAARVALGRRRRRGAVELHYDDGSMVTLEAGAPAGDRLLVLARAAALSARSS